MTASTLAWLAALGGGALLLVELAISVALEAASALNRPALRRLATEGGPRLAFLEHLQRAPSPHRQAAVLLRQVSLLGAALLFTLCAEAAELRMPALIGTAAAVLLGPVVLEALLARSLALRNPPRALRATAGMLRAAHLVLWPVIAPLHRILERIHAGYREALDAPEDEEVEALIEVGERSGLLEAAEGEMMRGIVDLDATLVREIMTPRTEIVALEAGLSVADARRRLLDAAHSRLPVYRQSVDNVIGVLHSRDLFQAWEHQDDAEPVSRYVRPAVFVPETLSAADLLAEMRQRTHLALVIDEYGGVAGLVTLEDVLEEIVGDIRDEHDEEELLVRADGDEVWIVDAVAHVEELESRFGVDFGEREFDTVGGLVVSRFGRVPASGETVETHGLDIEVLKADQRRVQRVRVRRARVPRSAAGGP